MISTMEKEGKLTYVSLTDIGVNHKKLGIPNQDAVEIEIVGDDFMVAVSDGVGSCKKAEIGAQTAVSICKRLFKDILSGKVTFDGNVIVRELVERWKQSLDGKLSDYCATIKTVLKIGKKAALISLGDGFVAITSEGMKMISPNEENAFNNETKCLGEKVCAGDFWTRNFDIDINTSYTVMACTDGVANAIHQGDELAFVEEIERNIGSDNLETELKDFLCDISQYSYDDKTLGVVKYER